MKVERAELGKVSIAVQTGKPKLSGPISEPLSKAVMTREGVVKFLYGVESTEKVSYASRHSDKPDELAKSVLDSISKDKGIVTIVLEVMEEVLFKSSDYCPGIEMAVLKAIIASSNEPEVIARALEVAQKIKCDGCKVETVAADLKSQIGADKLPHLEGVPEVFSSKIIEDFGTGVFAELLLKIREELNGSATPEEAVSRMLSVFCSSVKTEDPMLRLLVIKKREEILMAVRTRVQQTVTLLPQKIKELDAEKKIDRLTQLTRMSYLGKGRVITRAEEDDTIITSVPEVDSSYKGWYYLSPDTKLMYKIVEILHPMIPASIIESGRSSGYDSLKDAISAKYLIGHTRAEAISLAIEDLRTEVKETEQAIELGKGLIVKIEQMMESVSS